MDAYTCLEANHDTVALGTRTPVILIHGIHGNGSTDPANTRDENHFSDLIAYFNSNETFRSRYKLFRFHYRSDFLPVYQISRSLRNWVDDLVKQNLFPENRKFVIIAHSMGGLVARSYMNEHDTDYGATFKGRKAGERIGKLIALATPHHGTYAANDKARTRGESDADWGSALDIADDQYWEETHHCSACKDDPSHPNRGDLRFDNYNGFWSNNPAYVNDPKEQNIWLRDMPKSYDWLISAYYGYTGNNALVTDLGSMCPIPLGVFLQTHTDNVSRLTAAGVLIQRTELFDFGETIDPSDCGSDIFLLNNDGLVPVDSGMYKQGAVARRVQCAGYNHEDMQKGKGSTCNVLGHNISKPLFNLVLDELLAMPVAASDSQSPTVSINSPTSNPTHSTSNNSISLGGTASDDVTVSKVTWTNSRGGSGTAAGTTSWTANGIALQTGTNVLTVMAQDAAGNIGTDILTVTYSVSTSDTSSPTVTITAPTSSASYNTTGGTLTLRGTATDNVGVTQVTWTNSRGGSGTASGTTNWTANVTGLQSGTNLLTVRARDGSGNSGTDTLSVAYSPPPVCDGGTSETYRVNNGPPLHPNGTLIKLRSDPTVYLIRGGQKRGIPSQTILNNLYSQPGGGFQNKDVITVASDEFSRYSTGAVINSALPSNGRSYADGRLIQRVGGSEISVISDGVRRPFASESTFLGLGYLYCNVVPASDYDSYPVGSPIDALTTLVISAVTPNSVQTRDWGGSVTYTFTVVDGNGTPVSGAAVGGQDNVMGIGVFLATSATDSNGQGNYTTTVPTGKPNGTYDVFFKTDKAGYTGSEVVTRQLRVDHFQDTSPPGIVITSPTTNPTYYTSASVITLAGTTSDNVGVTAVSWTNDRGGSGTTTGIANWVSNGITLQSGTNVLTVSARDSAGNRGIAILTVIYSPPPTDITPPTISITSPTINVSYETTAGTLALGGTASDNTSLSQVTWENDRGGSGIASGASNWSVAVINLQPGFNVLTVVAADTSGNTGVDTIVVNYISVSSDVAAPSLVISTPANAETVTANPITISGTASDAGFGNNGISSVTVNGARATGDTVSGSGTANWSSTLNLNPGTNSITIIARDASPNQNSISRSVTVTLNATPTPTPTPGSQPILLTEQGTDKAIALDSVTFLRSPFAINATHNFGSDRVTRITVFATNLKSTTGQAVSPSDITVSLEDDFHSSYLANVESVRTMSDFDSLASVTFKFPEDFRREGNMWITIKFGGITSNRVRVPISDNSTREFLSFIEGNPGSPADGVLIDANAGTNPFAFEFGPAVPLADTTNGFTFTVFLPANDLSLYSLSFNVVSLQTTGPCASSFGAGGGFVAGRVTLNGTQGVFVNVPQAQLNSLVDSANLFNPGCNFTLRDLHLKGVYLYRENVSGPSILILDSISFGKGQNNFSGIRVAP